MSERSTLTRANLKSPRAAAIAGILFSVLLLGVLWLLRISVPDDPREPGAWLNSASNTVALAINLVAFAGIAFLWFIGVLRDRLGASEDKFFATVFFGSGLLFLGMLFAAAAVAGALIISFETAPAQLIESATFHFARAAAYSMMNVYTIKMAGVFMVTTSTIAIYTGFADTGLLVGAAADIRKLLSELELCRFSALGTGDEHLHFFRQCRRRIRLITDERFPA